MKSDMPKVLHQVGSKTMVRHVLDTVQAAGIDNIVVVVGYKAEEVMASLGEGPTYVLQSEQLGTGHAVSVVKDSFVDFSGTIMVLAGDVPLITQETIENLFLEHEAQGAAVTVLTAISDNPTGYGRIIRGTEGTVEGIVEEKDASSKERLIQEINTGTYCFDATVLFALIDKVNNHNSQGEYYLTDVISLAKQAGHKVIAVQVSDISETIGVNTLEQLVMAEQIYQLRGI